MDTLVFWWIGRSGNAQDAVIKGGVGVKAGHWAGWAVERDLTVGEVRHGSDDKQEVREKKKALGGTYFEWTRDNSR